MRNAHDLRSLLLAALAGCSETVTAADGAPADRPDVAADLPPPDAAVDVAPDVAPDVPLDAPPDVAPLCPGMSARECLTEAQVESRIRTPPQGGGGPVDAGADVAPIDVPRAANGCYVAGAVRDGCCVAASAVAREGELCCYTFCQGACCGRPFTVGASHRGAPEAAGSRWAPRGRAAPPAGGAARVAAARAWRDDARMEHASVASFARFTLHLLALGAPPELVADAQRAGLDEVDHARRCLAVAASLDGRALGLGALDVSGSLGPVTLLGALRAAVAEGCVGETLAALAARRRAELAADPTARAALARIADDEARHAALAWRFAAWAVAEGGAAARDAARAAFAEALAGSARAGEAAAEAPDAAWHALGLLTAREQRAVFEACRDEVIGPCAEALLGRG